MTEASVSEQSGYRVLARKYRPATFADLVGQDALVRTLRNAFAADRIAQAFMLTGIRGTGKTSTARIIAKGMNCIGADGTGGPTTEPCGICPNCRAISQCAHVDVIEMDAASNTGIDTIRATVIDSVGYAPSEARFKIFIIDEVHMLSTSAFNALLKTLEEPPAHVKFIFATTEIRKVPVTVLSRCQRFDLRRIEPEDMIGMLRGIAKAEDATISDEALALITRAAEGSARDATSLLDQAISHGEGETGAEAIRAMLGIADRGRVMDLFEMVMRGDAPAALHEVATQYADGADPLSVVQDLAEITHWISVIKVTPEAAEDPTVPPETRARGRALADTLSLRVLGRMWQMLLKTLDEMARAPNTMMAAEMALIRMTHVADLPPPEDLVRRLQDMPAIVPSDTPGPPTAPPSNGAEGLPSSRHMSSRQGHGARTAPMPMPADTLATVPALASFDDVVALIEAKRDVKLLIDVKDHVRLITYSEGRISFAPTPDAPADLAQRLGQRLQAWTGTRWAVTVERDGGAATITENQDAIQAALAEEAAAHPMFVAVVAAFPGARIAHVRSHEELRAAAAEAALPELADDGDTTDENWNPLEAD
ncbi:MAG: DNA polymerase III subunit gamma/tau [Pseudomonadota bacterium]